MSYLRILTLVIGLSLQLTLVIAQEQELKFGTFEGDLKDENGQQFIQYQATVPQPSGRRLGLIVGLHGINGNERQLTGSLAKALAKTGLEKDYMVLCLKSKGAGWENVDHDPILKSIAWAKKIYGIDERRVFGWGYSHGGFRYGVLGAEAQDVYAAVCIMGGGVRKPSSELRTLHYYLIHGDADTTVNVSSAHRALEVIKEAGFPLVYRELTGEGHGVSGSHRSFEARCDALAYFNRLRNPNVALSEQEQQAIDEATEALNDKRVSVKKVFPKLPYIAGKQTDAVLLAAAKSDDAKVLQAIAVTAQYYQFNDAVAVQLGTFLLHKKKQVKEAAVIALTRAAQWNHKQALAELIGFIKNEEEKDSDRAVVLMQLGLSVPLQLTCNNVQKDLFVFFISLLDHESTKLRTAAITALMGAAGGQVEAQKGKVAAEQMSESPRSGFGYHPKASDEKRAESIARWTKWLETKVAETGN